LNRANKPQSGDQENEPLCPARNLHLCSRPKFESNAGFGGSPGSQGKNLPNGTAMPVGEFQKNLRLRKSVPLIFSLRQTTVF
jgi:hypothetical protein